jgi:hypothetical protein
VPDWLSTGDTITLNRRCDFVDNTLCWWPLDTDSLWHLFAALALLLATKALIANLPRRKRRVAAGESWSINLIVHVGLRPARLVEEATRTTPDRPSPRLHQEYAADLRPLGLGIARKSLNAMPAFRLQKMLKLSDQRMAQVGDDLTTIGAASVRRTAYVDLHTHAT